MHESGAKCHYKIGLSPVSSDHQSPFIQGTISIPPEDIASVLDSATQKEIAEKQKSWENRFRVKSKQDSIQEQPGSPHWMGHTSSKSSGLRGLSQQHIPFEEEKVPVPAPRLPRIQQGGPVTNFGLSKTQANPSIKPILIDDSSDEEENQEPNEDSFAEELKMIKKQQAARNNGRFGRERSIREVLYIVGTWRKLFNGVRDDQGRVIRYRYDDAAEKLGLPKKSCDDYLLQIRWAKHFNFDFVKHAKDPIGVLRQFVNQNKSRAGGKLKNLKLGKVESSRSEGAATRKRK